MPVKLPRPLSHSSITLYGDCPQKYKFKYIDGIPEKPRHFFSFGQTVHLALEFFYGAKTPVPPTLEALLAHYKEIWISAGYRDSNQEAEYYQDGREILSRFHKKHAPDYHLPFFVEYGFTLSVQGVPVTGKVDRIDKLPDGRLAILDYKTGKALAKDRTLTDAQLTMYQMACEELLGAEVGRLTFYHLPSLKEHTVERRPGEAIGALKSHIVKTAENITGGLFEPKPDERKCQWCDYKPLCPVFRSQYGAAEPAPAAGQDQELAGLVDSYGQLLLELEELEGKAAKAKGAVLERMRRKGYVRAFGTRFEAAASGAERWEFSDKKKVLEILRQAGLYERVLAPSAPKVDQLMSDPALDGDLRARLQELGEKTPASDLKVKPL